METPLSRLPRDLQEFWDKLSSEERQLSVGDVFKLLEQNACDLDATDLLINTLTGLRNRVSVQFIEERYQPPTPYCIKTIDKLDHMIVGLRTQRDKLIEENFRNQQLQSVLEYKEIIDRMAYLP